METNSIVNFNESNITTESQFMGIKMEIKQEPEMYDFNQSMDQNQSNQNQSGMVNNFFYVINSMPNVNDNVSTSGNFSVIEYPKIKIEPDDPTPEIPESNYLNYYSLYPGTQVPLYPGTQVPLYPIHPDFKPNDLVPQPNHICVTDKIRFCIKDNGSDDNNLGCIAEPMQSAHDLNAKCANAFINELPKDVLGSYGITLEESECYSAEPDNAESDDDLEESKLVIDEEKDVQKPDDSSNNELSRTAAAGFKVEVKTEPIKAEVKTEVKTEIKTEVKTEEKSEPPKKPKSAARSYPWKYENNGRRLVISSVMSRKKKICIKCEEVFPSGIALLEHLTKHCSFSGCPEIFDKESDKGKHEQIHKDHPKKPFRCDFCRRRFHYYRFAQKHIKICQFLKKSKCPYCKYASSKVRQFNKHVAKHINRIHCSECKRKYSIVHKFTKHMNENHNKKVTFQCTECPRRFLLSETITNHITIHGLNMSDCGISRFIKLKNIGPG